MADSKLEIVLTAKDATGGVFGQVSGHIKGLVGSVFSLQGAVGALLGGAGIAAAAKSMYDTGIAAERLKVSMEAVTGGVKQAAEATRFVWEESNRLGLQFEGQVKGYQQLAAAAKAAGTDQNVLKGVYIGLGEAMTALQVPAEASERVIYAVSQMMSKGKVSAEELRQQMGESLPGSFALAAKAMGVTTSQLDDMLKAGKVHTEDFLPKFARVLHETYGVAATQSSDTLQAALNRLDNQWYKLQTTIMDSGPMEAAKGIIRDVADTVRAWIDNNEELIRQKVGEWAASAASAFKVLMDSIPAIISGVELLYDAFKDVAVLLGVGGAAFLAVANFPLLLAAVGTAAVGLSGAFGGLADAVMAYVRDAGAWLAAHKDLVVRIFLDIRKQLADDWVEIKDLFAQGWLKIKYGAELLWVDLKSIFRSLFVDLKNDAASFFDVFAQGMGKLAGMQDLWMVGPTAPFALMGKAAAELAPKLDGLVERLRTSNTVAAEHKARVAEITGAYNAAAMAQAETTAALYTQNEALVRNTSAAGDNAKASDDAARDKARQLAEINKLFSRHVDGVTKGEETKTKVNKAEAKKREKSHKDEAASYVRLWEGTFADVYRGAEDFGKEIRDIDAGITEALEAEAARRLDPWTGSGGYFSSVLDGWEQYADTLVRDIAPELTDDIDVMAKGALDPWTGDGGYFNSLDLRWVEYKDGIAEYKEPIRQSVEEIVAGAKDPWETFFDDMELSWDSVAESARDAMENIVADGRSHLSDGFFGLLKGDMDSFSDVWQGFWDDLLRVASDVMAEITIKTAISGLGDLIGIGSGSGSGSGSSGKGIFESIAGSAIGKGAGKVWGWLTGSSGAASGGTTAAAGAGVWSKLGALASNPWTWGIGAALLGGGMIARNAMQPEKRQSIDDTDFNFFDQINLNSSALNGGGDPMYTELANEAARAAQGDVVRAMEAYINSIPEQLRDGFRESLSKMSVHLGGGGMQIREDWLGEDTQVMYQGTLYAMFVDTFDPMIQMMERMRDQYGIDSSAFVAEGKKLQQDFFSFDPEGFWTGEYQTLFNSYYDWFGRVQEYQAGLAGQIDTAVAAQEATIKASLTMADIVKGSDKEYREIFAEYDKLFRDLGPTTEGYREWESAKLQKEMEEIAQITGNRVLAERWYSAQIEDLYEKIAEAHQKQLDAQESIASSTEQIANIVDRQLAEAAQAATVAKSNAPNGYSYATYGLQTGGLTFAELTERKKALWGHGYGFADGGLIDRLLVPRGEDGLIGVQYGEGIVSRQGMAALEAINNGSGLGSARPPVINVYIGNEKLDARIDYRADVLMTRKATRPGMDRRRAVR